MRPPVLAIIAALLAIDPPCGQDAVADEALFSSRRVTELLVASTPAAPADLSRRNLADLDLSGLDFKRAKLAGANLFGADLSGSNLSEADLSGARLDRVVLISTRLDRADLRGATLLRPSTYSTLAAPASEAASFVGANMAGARMFGRFNRANLSGSDLTEATFAPFNNTGFIEHIWRTELMGAKLEGVNLTRANLTYVLLAFSSLRGANLSGAVLKSADLSRADLTGADLTGADLSEADLDGTILVGVKGWETVTGLDTARNADRVVR